jgi:hypothetical protein
MYNVNNKTIINIAPHCWSSLWLAGQPTLLPVLCARLNPASVRSTRRSLAVTMDCSQGAY